MLQKEIKSERLHKSRTVRAKDDATLTLKMLLQKAMWERQWREFGEIEMFMDELQKARLRNRSDFEDWVYSLKGPLYQVLSRQLHRFDVDPHCKKLLTAIEQALVQAISREEDLWDLWKQDIRSAVPELKPTKPPRLGKEPERSDSVYEVSLEAKEEFAKEKRPSGLERKPERSDLVYQPRFSFLDKLISSRKEKKSRKLEETFESDIASWIQYEKTVAEWMEHREREATKLFSADLEKWRNYESQLNRYNAAAHAFSQALQALNDLQAKHIAGKPSAVVDVCDLFLMSSMYSPRYPQDYELSYDFQTKILIVEYLLPSIDHMPKCKEVKLGGKPLILLSETARRKLYDSALYQIALRSTYELYEADNMELIDSIVFNGWIRTFDKATGEELTLCILSLQTNRAEFKAINLAYVDPKDCFKGLKGVGSSKLHAISPVAPILQIDRKDKRFVSSYEVANSIDDSINLAAMDWEDFEHLVRELFEKEFAQDGGEVKVTQASRDGGVDAIAFDPDPLRGGKIVIQAKRYTNVVGVAAVRDLYGTIMNEGAMKGILVTTSEYGPDAYTFAKDKPITLLNGSNLLHLLEKHGHRARIDLREAKAIFAEREKDKKAN